jgi:hypothetical protein
MSLQDKGVESERNKAIIEYHKTHPGCTYEEIGAIFGLTKQRIHQIIRRVIPKPRKEAVMPMRFIKETIWTSPNFNRLSVHAERHFYRLLPLADDFGCFESSPPVIRGRCYPLQDIAFSDIEAWHKELEECDIITTWTQDGRDYAKFITFAQHQRIRHTHVRRTPAPPDEAPELEQPTIRNLDKEMDDIERETRASRRGKKTTS